MASLARSRRVGVGLLALAMAVSLAGAACSDASSAVEPLPSLSDVSGMSPAPQHGKPAPDFTVMTLDGAGFTLFEHLESDGRPVFLNMWASWCPPCRAEMPDIDAAAEAHEDVKFIGVASDDDPSDSAEFATSIGIGYTIGFDQDGDVSRSYDVVGLPASYVISPEGVILEQVFGAISEDDINEILDRWFS